MSVEVFQQTPPARPYRFELLPEDALASALQLLEGPLGERDSRRSDAAVSRGIDRALAFADARRCDQRAEAGPCTQHILRPDLRPGYQSVRRLE